MTQYNSLNVKLSNSQLNKLKSAIKNGTDVVLRLPSNMVGKSDDEANFPHILLLTNRQTLNLRKAFNNQRSADIKFSKALLTKRRVFKIFNAIVKIRTTFTNICSCSISNRCCNKQMLQQNTWIWKSYNINNF